MTAKKITRTRPYGTREEWLNAAIAALGKRFKAQGYTLPKVRISVGWPSGCTARSATIAECWHPTASSDQVGQIFVSPVLGDAARVLDVVMHELVHAVNHADGHNGHGKEFREIAVALGLTGKMTATVASPELAADMKALAKALGRYPHATIGSGIRKGGQPVPVPGDPGGPLVAHPPQGTRMLKVTCAEGSGYLVRMTRKWLDEVGAPICPCHRLTMLQEI